VPEPLKPQIPTLGALFDMDGVLVDSNPWHLRAWRELTSRHGLNLSVTQLRQGISGRISEDIVREFFRGLTRIEAVRLGDEKEVIFRALIHGQCRPLSGLARFLNRLRTHGIRTAVATSAPRANLDLVIDELRLGAMFDAFISAEQVERGKPDPEAYLRAAEAIGVPPRYCMIFEDATAGIEAGRAAGCLCIGIASARSAHELRRAGADFTSPDFDDLDAEALVRALQRYANERAGA
jgi:beta-phosphoglucomutase